MGGMIWMARDGPLLRLGIVLGLSLIVVGLAVGGTTFGLGEATSDRLEFRMDNEQLLLNSGDQEQTLVNDTSRISSVEFFEDGSAITVSINEFSDDPLSADDAETARTVVSSNDTVRDRLSAPVDAYDLHVEPILQLKSDSIKQANYTVGNASYTSGSNASVFEFETSPEGGEEAANGDSILNVVRAGTYLSDEVAVHVIHSATGEHVYTAYVNLDEERVVEFAARE